MYEGPWRSLPGTRLVDWPDHADETTLGDLAGRMIDELGIGELDLPIGSSLGGMVALEIAARVGSPDVVLIGSALDRDEICGFLRAAAPIASITPIRLLQVLGASAGGDLGKQFAQVDAAFIRAMCRAVERWEAPTFEGRVWRIHGERDRVIPCPAEDVDAVIAGAGHLVAMSHAEECVAALRRFLESRTLD